MDGFTNVMHVHDPAYQLRRQKQIDQLLRMNANQLTQQLRYQQHSSELRDEHAMSGKMLNEILSNQAISPQFKKGILDSTAGTTGSVLIRQDLEPTLYALFVRTFPAFERLKKGPANGLVHAANQITQPDSTNTTLGSTIQTELGTVSYVSSQFTRATFPIAVFATGRGVSIKELGAVAAGGAPYDPTKVELADGMVRLALDVQATIMQGNASNSGGTASQEAGLYNVNGFDGFRGVLGSVTAFSSNNAIQVDVASLNVTEAIQSVAAKAADNGGMPTGVYLPMNSKQQLDIENQGNKRYTDDTVEIIPGVRCTQVAWANGLLTLIPVPGTSIGKYNRTSDNALVEDIYVIDEATVTVRWLYSENFTVLQIPAGVDGVLSERYILFGMFGLEIAAPLFCGKARRIAS